MAKRVQYRDWMQMTITGVKKIGKTYQTLHMIGRYVSDNSATGKKAGKVLIFDVNQEYTNAEVRKAGLKYNIKTINLDNVKRFAQQSKVEVRRVLPIRDDGTDMNLDDKVDALGRILAEFRNGLVVVEDVNVYMTNVAHSKEVLGSIVSHRHRNQDIIATFQSLSALDPRMWQNTGIIRFHYQTDDVDRYKQRIPCFELVKIGQILVNQKYFGGDKRFFIYIDQYSRLITGNFNRREFMMACREYLSEDQVTVRKEMNKGGMVREKAINNILTKYTQYYGNAS